METQQLETAQKRAAVPLRARGLLYLGWALLVFSLVLLLFDALWMWQRSPRGALLVAIGLATDALVGFALVLWAKRIRRAR